MADFTPRKVKEAGKAVGSLPHDNTEYQAPPVLHLEEHHLAKLGMDKMPPVGSKIKISGLAHVGAVSENQDRDGGKSPRRSMTLHLHQMETGIGKQPDMSDESQKAGAKAEIDKALKKAAGSSAKKGSREGPTPAPRGGQD